MNVKNGSVFKYRLCFCPSAAFLPENVFLLLQSVVVSVILFILKRFMGFPDASASYRMAFL